MVAKVSVRVRQSESESEIESESGRESASESESESSSVYYHPGYVCGYSFAFGQEHHSSSLQRVTARVQARERERAW